MWCSCHLFLLHDLEQVLLLLLFFPFLLLFHCFVQSRHDHKLCDSFGNSPLMVACEMSARMEVINFLLSDITPDVPTTPQKDWSTASDPEPESRRWSSASYSGPGRISAGELQQRSATPMPPKGLSTPRRKHARSGGPDRPLPAVTESLVARRLDFTSGSDSEASSGGQGTAESGHASGSGVGKLSPAGELRNSHHQKLITFHTSNLHFSHTHTHT